MGISCKIRKITGFSEFSNVFRRHEKMFREKYGISFSLQKEIRVLANVDGCWIQNHLRCCQMAMYQHTIFILKSCYPRFYDLLNSTRLYPHRVRDVVKSCMIPVFECLDKWPICCIFWPLDLSRNKSVSVLSSRRELWKLTITHGTVELPCCPVLSSVWKIEMFNLTLNWSNLRQHFTRPKLEKRTRHSLHIHDWDHFPSLC